MSGPHEDLRGLGADQLREEIMRLRSELTRSEISHEITIEEYEALRRNYMRALLRMTGATSCTCATNRA